jgi:peptidoglycan/LPS O-acetylase OafA/YrhL
VKSSGGDARQLSGRLDFLDGIRGMAILAVFLYHSLGVAFARDQLRWSGWTRDFDVTRSFLALYPLTYGFAGVAMFFVVSGFCIHQSHRRSLHPGWLYFFTRRFFRIYPPYLITVLLFAFFWPYGFLSPTVATEVAFHVLAIQNFDMDILAAINPAFWSIAVEIQLYAIYPLLLLLVARVGWKSGLLIVGTVEIGIRACESLYSTLGNGMLPTFVVISVFSFWLSWSIGAFMSECHDGARANIFSRIRFDVASVIVFLLPLYKPTWPFTFFGFAVLTAIALDRLLSGRWSPPRSGTLRVAWTHLRGLGRISYSFYLIHLPILVMTRPLVGRVNADASVHPLLLFALCCASYPFVYFWSHLLWRYAEQPSVALGSRIWRVLGKSRSTQGVAGT